MPGSQLKVLPATTVSRLPADDVGLLVHLQADAVAQAVDEVVAVAAGADDVARGRIERLERDTRADRGARRGLAGGGELVDPCGTPRPVRSRPRPATQTVRVISE